MISILLPTTSRPDMLHTALASIAAQTICDQIDNIFVSENGGNRDSEIICAKFPELPITYIFRRQVTPLEHAQLLMRECLQSEFTAILHDDDWWTPAHLATALASLKTHADASLYGSGHFVVSGESSMLNCSGNLFPWFGASYPRFQPVWELSRMNVLMAQLLGTISHYSTLVIRTDSLRAASYVYDLNNPFDNDRMLIFALSQTNSVLFHPIPGAFVRNHGEQDCYVFDGEARIRHMCETTRWMVETSGKSWDMISNTFSRRMAMCPREAAATLKSLASREWCWPELNRQRQGKVLQVA
jgi:hypothetical protein